MATSNSIIKASQDRDLRERFIAIAAEQGVQNPQAWVEARLPALACAPIESQGRESVASVYEYADAQYQEKLGALILPGKDPAAVTDEHLRYAVKVLNSSGAAA